MIRESLARKFKPAGFEQPEGSRREYTKPRSELREAFERWNNEWPTGWVHREIDDTRYKEACEAIKHVGEISYKEANALVFDFKPKTEREKNAGLFVSACYTHSPEEVIVFDINAPEINYIGYRTIKPIINNGVAGGRFASSCPGPIVNNGGCGSRLSSPLGSFAVNNGKCGDWFGWGSVCRGASLLLNNGECGDNFADMCSGYAFAVKEPKHYASRKETVIVIGPECCAGVPELKEYLTELEDITKEIKDDESAKKFLERYGPNPKERIGIEMKEILGIFIQRGLLRP